MFDQETPAPGGGAGAHGALPRVVRHTPEFSGTTGEYFGIWFVNLLLSILTLGIYSAWAKVRTERYFYSHTRLAGASFEYLANPIAILKGRLIAYAVVIALGVSSKFAPLLYAVLLLAVFAAMPVLVVLSLRFRARYSAWRGLRFRFTSRLREGYDPFLGWPILNMISLTLLYPKMKKRQHEFLVGGHRFGHQAFSFHGQTGAYYTPYVEALVGYVGLGLAVVALSSVVKTATYGADAVAAVLYQLALFVPLYLVFIAVLLMLATRYRNLLWNNTRLGAHRFESTLRARDMVWLYLSNAVAIVFTLGLAVPWAMVRLARYRAQHLTLVASGELDEFVAEAEGHRSAAGAELVDALEFDLDIGF